MSRFAARADSADDFLDMYARARTTYDFLEQLEKEIITDLSPMRAEDVVRARALIKNLSKSIAVARARAIATWSPARADDAILYTNEFVKLKGTCTLFDMIILLMKIVRRMKSSQTDLNITLIREIDEIALANFDWLEIIVHAQKLTQKLTSSERAGDVVNRCNKCDKTGLSKCSGCKVSYCSPVCQKADWKTHKKDCKSTVRDVDSMIYEQGRPTRSLRKCKECLERPKFRCNCLGEQYCSYECQRDDWKEHKKKCPVRTCCECKNQYDLSLGKSKRKHFTCNDCIERVAKETKEKGECAICYSDDEEKYYKLPCSHYICEECLTIGRGDLDLKYLKCGKCSQPFRFRARK